MKDTTYTIAWQRVDHSEDGIMTCSGLTPRIAFARLISGIKTSGPILVHSIEREKIPYAESTNE